MYIYIYIYIYICNNQHLIMNNHNIAMGAKLRGLAGASVVVELRAGPGRAPMPAGLAKLGA